MRKSPKNNNLAKPEIKYFLNLAKLGDLIKSKPPLGGLRFNSPGLTPPWGPRNGSTPIFGCSYPA